MKLFAELSAPEVLALALCWVTVIYLRLRPSQCPVRAQAFGRRGCNPAPKSRPVPKAAASPEKTVGPYH